MQELGLSAAVVKREVSFALQIINKNKKLLDCTAASKQEAVLNVANVGLSLDPIQKLAYLVPRWNSHIKANECHLSPDYRGLVKVLTDTGSVLAISAHLVYENDVFVENTGDFENPVTHQPKSFGNRGELVGVYAIAALPNGLKQHDTMDVDQINEIRDKSESYKAFIEKKITSCIWESDYPEMARKSIIRRLTKYLPKSKQNEMVSKVIELDTVEYKPSGSQKTFALGLLETSDIVERMETYAFEQAIETGSSQQLEETIEILKTRQKETGIYSAAEINNIVKDKAG